MSDKRAPTKDISYSELTEWFYVDSTSPSGLRWKQDCELRGKTHANFRAKDDVAGHKSNSYWTVTHRGKEYSVSRVIYCLVYGSIPIDKLIDHIDGDKFNNKVENLRLVDHEINGRNRKKNKKNKNNKTGYTGISRVVIPNRSNGYNEYYRVVIKLKSRKITKSFNIATFGEELALEKAAEYKQSLTDLLQSDGYTERHVNE